MLQDMMDANIYETATEKRDADVDDIADWITSDVTYGTLVSIRTEIQEKICEFRKKKKKKKKTAIIIVYDPFY